MNKEICQKCKYQVRYFNIDNISHGCMYFHGYNYIGNLVCQCNTKDADIIDRYSDILVNNLIAGKPIDIPATEFFNINEIKPMEMCPYYMEHQLTDWNENEHKNM